MNPEADGELADRERRGQQRGILFRCSGQRRLGPLLGWRKNRQVHASIPQEGGFFFGKIGASVLDGTAGQHADGSCHDSADELVSIDGQSSTAEWCDVNAHDTFPLSSSSTTP